MKRMDKKRFDEILIEEGFDDVQLRDRLWKMRPSDYLIEDKLREVAREFKNQQPKLRRELGLG